MEIYTIAFIFLFFLVIFITSLAIGSKGLMVSGFAVLIILGIVVASTGIEVPKKLSNETVVGNVTLINSETHYDKIYDSILMWIGIIIAIFSALMTVVVALSED